jgi:diguanylate cyclase (GGDEF)-like protein
MRLPVRPSYSLAARFSHWKRRLQSPWWQLGVFAAVAAVGLLGCLWALNGASRAAQRQALRAHNQAVCDGVHALAQRVMRIRVEQAAERVRQQIEILLNRVETKSLSEAAAKEEARKLIATHAADDAVWLCALKDRDEFESAQPAGSPVTPEIVGRMLLRPNATQAGESVQLVALPGGNKVLWGCRVQTKAWGWTILALAEQSTLQADPQVLSAVRANPWSHPADDGGLFSVVLDPRNPSGAVLTAPTWFNTQTDTDTALSPRNPAWVTTLIEEGKESGVKSIRWRGPAREGKAPYEAQGWAAFDTAPSFGWMVATFAPDSVLTTLTDPLPGTASKILIFFSLLLTAAALGWIGYLLHHLRQAETLADRVVDEVTAERTEELTLQIRDLERHLEAGNQRTAQLEETNCKLSSWVDELTQTSREIALLNQMSDLLQACQTVEETDGVIVQLARQLFPADSGVLSRYNADQNAFEVVTAWGEPVPNQELFLVDDCWALRRGKVYSVENHETDLLCKHLDHAPQNGYICLPMVAQGETLGLLHLQWGATDTPLSEEARKAQFESKKQLITTVTEQFALALANLKLREMLRIQSIRDQLTGLYNRRHMEDTLGREVHRAKRRNAPLGVIMLDVDHFKKFNDTYGHEEGDKLLHDLGAILQSNIRQEDVPCRYGGEEFLIILPDAPLEAAVRRAEFLRQKIKSTLRVQQQSVTVSMGVAVYPEHGLLAEGIVAAADEALYAAKHMGRDRVVVWKPMSA